MIARRAIDGNRVVTAARIEGRFVQAGEEDDRVVALACRNLVGPELERKGVVAAAGVNLVLAGKVGNDLMAIAAIEGVVAAAEIEVERTGRWAGNVALVIARGIAGR